eukprot:9500233-Pyramimonas_sp.AAC.1
MVLSAQTPHELHRGPSWILVVGVGLDRPPSAVSWQLERFWEVEHVRARGAACQAGRGRVLPRLEAEQGGHFQ